MTCKYPISAIEKEKSFLFFSCPAYGHTHFPVDMLARIDASPDFLRQVCFLDEATFHVNGAVNRYNCRICGNQNQHVTCELERGSPKLNVWAGFIHDKLSGPFFFS
jgi:hypothetical protein